MLQKHNKNSKTITKKHIFVIATTILSTIAFFLLSSCGEQTDSPNIEMQITTFFNASNFSNAISQNKQLDNTVQKAVGRQQYIKNIARLDKLLSVSSGNDENCKEYMERIDTNYLFTTDFSNNCGGGLQAWHNENRVCSYRLIMETPNKEICQQYQYRMLSDESFWFTYQTSQTAIGDLPDYVVNEDVLQFYRTDDVYDDGNTNIDKEQRNREQEVKTLFAEKITGQTQEYWCTEGSVYQIERNNALIIDVSDKKESLIGEFLQQQRRRLQYQIIFDKSILNEIEQKKPKGYSLLFDKNGWDMVAVCDLNHDGMLDYVAALYPNDYEEVHRFEGFSPYEMSSQYYAAGFWLLLSSENGQYEQIELSIDIEYWEDTLSLITLDFVEDGILRMEYYIGRAPWVNAELLFEYNEEEKDFYLARSYYRQSMDIKDALLIGNKENYTPNKVNIYCYLTYNVDVFENVSEHRDDILMQDGVLMSYYWNDLYYKCNDIVQQHTINSKIWEIEYEILENIEKQFPAVKEMSMCIKPTFYNARMVSGYFEIRMQKQKENSRKTREIPIMVDKQSGELITVKELIAKQDFLEIFDNWAADAVAIGKLTEEEGAFCREKIEQCWEYGETLDNYFGEKESFLSFWFEQKGVKIGIYPQKKDAYRPVYYTIDKEYFFATPLWKYLEPEYQIAGKEY